MITKDTLFDLNYQYDLYLERVGLDKDTMHPVQAVETKRAFFGACGQVLVLLRDDMPDDETTCVVILQAMHDQVGLFWSKQNTDER